MFAEASPERKSARLLHALGTRDRRASICELRGNAMAVINGALCVVACALLALLFVEAESDMRPGHMLADTEIAAGRYATTATHVTPRSELTTRVR